MSKRIELPAGEVLAPLRELFKANFDALDEIMSTGEIAGFIWKVSPDVLKSFGVGPGEGPFVVKLPGSVRKNLKNSDAVTSQWVRGGRTGRVFVVWTVGTLLVNFNNGIGWSLEPGSTDAEVA